MKIKIDRTYLPDTRATLGKLTTESGFECYTLELPWKNNQRGVSCIPEGEYVMYKRKSGVVQRTSRGEFPEGWEVTDVEGRGFIMFHVGNYTRDSDGCILVGNDLAWNNHGFMVTNSVVTFRKFMQALSNDHQHTLEVRQYRPVSPSEAVSDESDVLTKDEAEKSLKSFLERMLNKLRGRNDG